MPTKDLEINGYEIAVEVDPYVNSTIKKYPKFKELKNCKFVTLFRNNPIKKGEKLVFGSAQAMSKKMKAIAPADFIIEIWYEAWGELDEEKREALIFHELSHCKYEEKEKDGEIKYYYKSSPHDFEGFNDELELFGNWTGNLPENLLETLTNKKES